MTSTKTSLIALSIVLGLVYKSQAQFVIGNTEIDTTTIVTGLDTPWEILWGPDDHIWLTERPGKISRLNPESGELTELLTIGDVYENNEGGLLGMVLHPDFINHPYVFVVYNYLGSSGTEERLVRYTYFNGQLSAPLTMLEGIDGAGNHNGSRLVIDGARKLYMTTGDAATPSQSQDLNSLNGKVLRLNLDGSVPEDNPIPGSYIWSWGHRNAQGLVISPLGVMYSSEHGTTTDDEVNIIEKGRNYGWPNVEGFCDDPGETQFCADSNVVEPIAAWTPTLAVAGTDYYGHPAIPEWQNSLLVTSLKQGSLAVLNLNQDGKSVIGEELLFYYWWGRLRDVCVSPDGRIFLAVSNRDGRGVPRDGDDRIVELESLSFTEFCARDESLTICPGETYDFYGQELSQAGVYIDTLANANGCDTIVTLSLSFFEAGDTGLEESVSMAQGDTITLSANEGFISYQWNNNPSLDERAITIIGAELDLGTYYYSLRVEEASGCMLYDTVEVKITPYLNIHNQSSLEFSVYPNPVSGDELQLEYQISSEAKLMIISQDGREVGNMILYPGNTHTLVTLPEAKGLYHIMLTNKQGSRYRKILKL